MTVISVSGELGSEGNTIAQDAAQTLGYCFADRTVIESILNQYGFVEYGRNYDKPLGFWSHLSYEEDQRSKMVDMLNRVILALAQHGHVVVASRSSFAILGGFANVLNVRIEAPFAVRIKRVMELRKFTEPEQAEVIVKESDEARKAFLKWYYGAEWNSSDPFDLMIDTGKISPGLATQWLVEAATSLETGEGSKNSTTDTILVDSILASTISDILEHQVLQGR